MSKTYSFFQAGHTRNADGEPRREIMDESAIAACERGIDQFASWFPKIEFGNADGFIVENATLEYDPAIFDGAGGGVITLVTCGSDGLIGYDPRTDEPKTNVFWVRGVTAKDVPEAYAFEITERTPFDPFNIPDEKLRLDALPAALGIIDEIVRNHCTNNSVYKDEPFGVSMALLKKYYHLQNSNPILLFEHVRQAMQRCRPKNDKATQRLMRRLDELAFVIADTDTRDLIRSTQHGRIFVRVMHSKTYFERENAITALEWYRSQRDMTREMLAEKIGISTRQLARYEKRDGSSLGTASKAVVKLLAQELGVTENDLVSDGIPVLVRMNGQVIR